MFPEDHASESPSFFQRLFQPIDIASLVVFRIAFGAIMTWEALRYLVPRVPDGVSWARQFYIDPSILFTYYGFSWVQPWPGDGMIYHFWAWALAGVCVTVGFCYRLSAIVLCLLVTHVFLLDHARYLNHMYLMCLLSFLIIFLPLNRAVSIDAKLWPSIRGDVAPAWTLHLLRFQMGLVYVFSGIARANGDWMHGEPMRTWLRSRGEESVFSAILMSDWAPYIFSFGGMLFDLLIVPLLLWRRTRPIAFCAAVLFHLSNAYLFHIGVFPWLGIATTTLFLYPAWPRRAWG
ncbi:MAG: HTTM domain-containing protein, partial [Planctomycetota bacterium]|nr:HTTM domain-containing protein [Planctomycetota bacterium]